MVRNHIVFVLEVGGECGEVHVEPELVQVTESHRFVCKPRVAQGGVDGGFVFQDLVFGSVEGEGIDNLCGVEKDAVEIEMGVDDEGGIDGLLSSSVRF